MKEYNIIFWDFDGVIKESVEVKSEAFERLFLPYGREVADRVRRHHEANGGMSRFDKIPIYLGWAGEPATEEMVREFCSRFAQAVQQAVIDAAWVPGVREYLETHHSRQCFVLVTATPLGEIQHILQVLGIARCFREVYGAPMPKAEAMRKVLQREQCLPERALAVGDSESDFRAAAENGVPFLLRRTPLNKALQELYRGPSFECMTIDE